jgi:hypothetical protein
MEMRVNDPKGSRGFQATKTTLGFQKKINPMGS